MLLIATALALLVVYAGVKLLIQVKKETLGNLYKGAAWFFIVAGFATLASAGALCVAKCVKYGTKMMYREHRMRGGDGYNDMKKRYKHHKKMMKYHERDMRDDKVVCVNYGCCPTDKNFAGDACPTDTLKKTHK